MPVTPQSYNPLVPQASDLLNQSQPQLLTNSGALQSWIDQNHVDYAVAGNQPGKHTFVQMPAQTTTPAGGYLAGEDTISVVTSTVTTRPELLFTRGTGAAIGSIPQQYEITTYGTGSYTFASGSGNIIMNYGWTRLPSGIIMLWANQTNRGPGMNNPGLNIIFPSVNLTPPNTFPGFAALYNVQISEMSSTTGAGGLDVPIVIIQGSYTTTQFQITTSSNGQYQNIGSISYLAIGV
jgi:hypothetical protein